MTLEPNYIFHLNFIKHIPIKFNNSMLGAGYTRSVTDCFRCVLMRTKA